MRKQGRLAAVLFPGVYMVISVFYLFISQFLIGFVFLLGKFFGFGKEFFCDVREGSRQGGVTGFTHEVFAERLLRFFGVEDEGVLAFFLEQRIVAIEVPVTTVYGAFHFMLGIAHTAFDAVVDARCVSDDDGRAVVGFCFFDGFDELIRIGAESDLGNVDVSIGHEQAAQVFLIELAALCSELGDSTDWRSFRRLTAGIGVNFGVDEHDIDVGVHSQDVV